MLILVVLSCRVGMVELETGTHSIYPFPYLVCCNCKRFYANYIKDV
jgi:hypothetical protein